MARLVVALSLAVVLAPAQAAPRTQATCNGIAARVETARPETIATACEGARDALAAMPGAGFAHDAEINDFRYAFDPMLFGVESYRHWLRQPDGVAFLRSVIRGSIVPEMPP